ncbi:hypothetical protein T492DRAFT_1052956 [Pavlovales sp. CCMP2436]|nr:hypothetical protein T492DRAFT_1052956 [Pavlovales sp. CCMP2436]
MYTKGRPARAAVADPSHQPRKASPSSADAQDPTCAQQLYASAGSRAPDWTASPDASEAMKIVAISAVSSSATTFVSERPFHVGFHEGLRKRFAFSRLRKNLSRFVLVRHAIMCTLEGATAAARTAKAEGCTAKPETAAAMATSRSATSFMTALET